jgi:hypothetical protein
MAEMATVAAPSGAIAMSLAVMRCLGRGSVLVDNSIDDHRLLPEPFQGLCLDSLLTIASKIGMLATVHPALDAPVGTKEKLYSGPPISNEASCAEIAQMMHAADEIIRDWPRSMDAVILSLADRNQTPPRGHPVHSIFSTRMGYRLLGRIKSVDGTVIRLIEDVLEDWLLRERGIYIDGRRRSKVGVRGDVAIDVADALRRLEGQSVFSLGISAWAGAGSVEMIGRKVSLASVEVAVEEIAQLGSSDFDEAMSAEDWNDRSLKNEHYRRSNAIRDIFSGSIRVKRTNPNEHSGLASVQICREDYIRRAGKAKRAAQFQRRSPMRRAQVARERDSFHRPGVVYALLSALWPGAQIPDIAAEPSIRCKTKVWIYPDRDVRQHFYSVADALDLIAERNQ